MGRDGYGMGMGYLIDNENEVNSCPRGDGAVLMDDIFVVREVFMVFEWCC